jgi:hypothetical protein
MPPPTLRQKLPVSVLGRLKAPGPVVAPGLVGPGVTPGREGWVVWGAVLVLGAVVGREPRLPMDRPPPARAARASLVKTQVQKNRMAKRTKQVLRQVLVIISFPPVCALFLVSWAKIRHIT